MPKQLKLFHRAHYNILAKQLRDNWPLNESCQDFYVTLIHSLAVRFYEDNNDFKVHMFLQASAPKDKWHKVTEFWDNRFLLDYEDD